MIYVYSSKRAAQINQNITAISEGHSQSYHILPNINNNGSIASAGAGALRTQSEQGEPPKRRGAKKKST